MPNYQFADIVVLNGKIWTGDPVMPWAEAIAATGEYITTIGSTPDIKGAIGPKTQVIDAKNKLVIPGLIDNHTHLMIGGLHLLTLDLRNVLTAKQFVQAVAEKALDLAPGHWITGGSWDHEQWPEGKLPEKSWLDPVTPTTPVFLTRADLHMGVANTLALQLAGITKETPDPAGGVIERDANGEPTGILKDTAMNIILSAIPKPTQKEYDQALIAAMNYAASVGITSVQDITAWKNWDDWESFVRFHQLGALTLRIYARTPITEWEKQQMMIAASGRGDDWLQLGGVKGFVDGALGSATAYMFEPYTDAPDTCGLLVDQMYPEGIMLQRIFECDKAGMPVSIHAIGDRANNLLLDIFEAVIKENGPRDRRFRIEHAQHLLPEDINRMAKHKVIASVQPAHLADDGCWAERRLGDERCQSTYAFGSLVRADVPVTFGTDWPVVPLNPFTGIQAAVTRQTKDDRYPDGWIPQQKISVEQALHAYTSAGAYAEFSEHRKGTLTVGKLADMVVLSQDIFTIEPNAIGNTTVLYTMVGGKIVYAQK